VPDILVHPQTGREIWESVTFGPHRDAEGKIIGAIALVRDVSERKQAEKALEQALAEVEALKNRLQAENKYLQDEIRREHNFEEIVGSSPSLLELLRKVERVAQTDSTVMLYGETGTGKELIARALHNSSRRKDRPLVKVNCGAIPSALVESELFGHVKGAFTGALERRVGRFELANGGTLFLDEVGELPPDTQVKLLRILQEQEFEPVGSSKTMRVDVRILAATNRNLEEAVQGGRFRSDLFYRLNVLPLLVPPLRERREDIPQLALFFLDRYCKKAGKEMEGVSRETMDLLQRYAWPGNIRELQNVIERGVALASGQILHLGPDLLPIEGPGKKASAPAPGNGAGKDDARPSRLPLEEVEKLHILSILQDTKGVIEGPNGAAGILGLHPNTLRSKMKKLGITRT
jgi:formate hydrogenlyase transcriptional activator